MHTNQCYSSLNLRLLKENTCDGDKEAMKNSSEKRTVNDGMYIDANTQV